MPSTIYHFCVMSMCSCKWKALVGGWRWPVWRWRCSWCPSPRCPSLTCTAARSGSGPSTLTGKLEHFVTSSMCVLIDKKLFATFAPINWLPFYLFRKLSKKLLLWQCSTWCSMGIQEIWAKPRAKRRKQTIDTFQVTI